MDALEEYHDNLLAIVCAYSDLGVPKHLLGNAVRGILDMIERHA